MWQAILAFLFIFTVKVLAKYMFYSQKDPRARRARRQEELKKREELLKAQNGPKRTGYYVTGLYIYPVKSCKGIALTSAEIGRFGFVNDRRWMIVDAETHRFISQRALPQMSLITPALLNSTKSSAANGKNAAYLQLQAPGIETPLLVHIPHPNPKDLIKWETSTRVDDPLETAEGEVIEVTVWGDTFPAIDEGEEASQWLSKYLSRDVKLVRLLHNNGRRVPKEYEVDSDDKVLNLNSFADGFPFLLSNEVSLRDLNEKLKAAEHDPLPMIRFRPNIVVDFHRVETEPEDTTPPADLNLLQRAYDEDDWKEIRIGGSNTGITFYPVKKCSRCKETTVDPEVGDFTNKKKPGEKYEQPLEILHSYRSDGKAVYFAQNLIHRYHPSLQKQSVLVGDQIHVIERHGVDIEIRRVEGHKQEEEEEKTSAPASVPETIIDEVASSEVEGGNDESEAPKPTTRNRRPKKST